jgi:integrase
VFALYELHRSPRKSEGEQVEDGRRAELWSAWLGGQKDPHLISLGEWEGFIEARRSGEITGRGLPVVRKEDRVPMRSGTVQADCTWLRQVLGWATRWRHANERYLLRENAVRGYEIPAEKNPRRPVATTDRFEKLRAMSDAVTMARWQQRRSYLSELLDIAYETGRRISAILGLRYDDLRLARTANAPYGSIQWPGETDKMGKEWSAPVTARVRAALDRVLRERPGIGPRYLFPSPTNPELPVSKDLASAWLERAERLAEVPKQHGSLWHAYRRGWVTARKHLPDADVAQAGGWRDLATLKECYQQPDGATILAVVLGGHELREQQA